MEEYKVQILIPTFNNVKELDRTMQSIKEQEYNQEDVYITIVDFGSTDGTYEKILSYPSYNLGIYRKEGITNRRQMIAEAERILEYVRPKGYCFSFVLYPGDVIYPNCLNRCTEVFAQERNCTPGALVFEVDIRDSYDNVIKQPFLYSEVRILERGKNTIEYISYGYSHYVLGVLDGAFQEQKYKASSENNELRFWNKMAIKGNAKNIIYLPEVLACVKAIRYEDELEEILYRWETAISLERFYENRYGVKFDNRFAEVAHKNTAKYALWRSWILYKDDANRKEIEDCFLIASVIYPKIVDEELYRCIEQVVINGNTDKIKDVEQILQEER